MATTHSSLPEAPAAGTRPKRVFFPPATTADEPEPAPSPVTELPVSLPATPSASVPVLPGTATSGKKRGPKPSAEPREHRTFKLKHTHLEQLEAMLEDAPRHVLKQDLMDFILSEFFARNPKLPDELRKRKRAAK